jgi:hypothetical protein
MGAQYHHPMPEPVTAPSPCNCGHSGFRPVEVDRGPHRPLYRTEFIACQSCGAVYHRREPRRLFSPTGAAPKYEERLPAFRPEVDTADWVAPPEKVWTDEP